jgi:3',5'-cyclic AMP phosphodiesterase CpdA
LGKWLDVAADEANPSETVHVTLLMLDPDTEYVYRVILSTSEGDVASPVGYFVTEPAPGDTVQFVVLSDTQWQWEGENRLQVVGDAIAADATPFDFILHAGDLVETPGSVIWDHWFDSFSTMLLRAPFLPVLGNHEAGNRSYYNNFVLPPGAGKNDERWWAFHWGDVVIVGLDTDVTKASDYIAQQNWARLHLSGPETHKIVMFHYPVYSSDAYHGSGYSLDVIYHPIFVEAGVDLVINGHAHNYERIQADGITYLVVGGGGAVPRALAETRVAGSILAIEGYNFYLRVTAAPEGIGVEVVSVAQASEETFELTDGHLLDTFLLPTYSEAVPDGSEPNWLLILIGLLGAAAAAFFLLRGMDR